MVRQKTDRFGIVFFYRPLFRLMKLFLAKIRQLKKLIQIKFQVFSFFFRKVPMP